MSVRARTRRRLLAAIAVGGVLLGTSSAWGADAVSGDAAAQGESGAANFIANCAASHSAADDPIVFPGQVGASHLHDFFGNRSTNAFSTVQSLDAATSTCMVKGLSPGKDRSAYWVPAASQNGVKLTPLRVLVYYQLGRRKPGNIRPFPHGFKMIAGDSHATSPQDVVRWGCTDGPSSAEPPTCPVDQKLVLRITFPDCWDGVRLDSTDHRSHVAYSMNGACPSTHPVQVPRLFFAVRYQSQGGLGVTLSSGGQYSGHADFFNAWEPAALQERVNSCLNAAVRCG
jgi:hypothetical protein